MEGVEAGEGSATSDDALDRGCASDRVLGARPDQSNLDECERVSPRSIAVVLSFSFTRLGTGGSLILVMAAAAIDCV